MKDVKKTWLFPHSSSYIKLQLQRPITTPTKKESKSAIVLREQGLCLSTPIFLFKQNKKAHPSLGRRTKIIFKENTIKIKKKTEDHQRTKQEINPTTSPERKGNHEGLHQTSQQTSFKPEFLSLSEQSVSQIFSVATCLDCMCQSSSILCGLVVGTERPIKYLENKSQPRKVAG